MDSDSDQTPFRGVLVYTVTPFRDGPGFPLDEDGLRRNVGFLVEHGVGTIVPCGHTGEFWSLGPREHLRVVQIVVETVREAAMVIAGVGRSLPEAISQVEQMEAYGCAAVSILAPPGRVSERGHLAYIRGVAQHTGLPVMVEVNTPASSAFLQELMTISTVQAIKDTTADLSWFRRSIRVVQGRLHWIVEGESSALYYLLNHASGVTSGVANFVPELPRAFVAAAARGDYRLAVELQRMLDPWTELRARPGNQVTVVKAAMDRVGLAGGAARPPIAPLEQGDREDVERLLLALERGKNSVAWERALT